MGKCKVRCAAAVDDGDSDVSEERHPEDFINSELAPVQLQGDHDRPSETVSLISSAFNNK